MPQVLMRFLTAISCAVDMGEGRREGNLEVWGKVEPAVRIELDDLEFTKLALYRLSYAGVGRGRGRLRPPWRSAARGGLPS